MIAFLASEELGCLLMAMAISEGIASGIGFLNRPHPDIYKFVVLHRFDWVKGFGPETRTISSKKIC